jgi:NADH dehydrogenase [ubiquinone] 1 alpha subcomplex assembly factor 7
MTSDVRSAIRAAIEDHGPITFAEYMQLALYGPGGYYEHPPVGAAGDFVTSPHVHPIFGELLANGIRELWTNLGSPEPFRLVEVGAGDGTLARQLLAALADVPVSYTAVEISNEARDALASIDGIEVLDELPRTADVVLAHELLDNLPFRVVRGGREVRIASSDDRFREELVELDEELADDVAELGAAGIEIAEGDVVVPVGAFTFIDRLATMVRPGYALLIDYGGVGSKAGEVHGYRRHRLVEDPLRDPGATDVTAGVDFTAIARRATIAGLGAHGPISQHDALLALGFERWIRDELGRQHEQLERRDGIEAVRTWSGRSRATLLADPAALGRLRWMLLASAGLPAPRWMAHDVQR